MARKKFDENPEFAKILEEFELCKSNVRPKRAKKVADDGGRANFSEQFAAYLTRHSGEEICGKGEVAEDEKKYENARKMPVAARLDVHGLTAQQLEFRLDGFVSEAKIKGWRKILVIHGKGIHSKDEPILRDCVRKFAENDARIGEFGKADARDGGSGATWMALKSKN